MMNWKKKAVEHLRNRWTQGASAGVVAAELHTTREAVLGKVNRLGLHHPKGKPTEVVIKTRPVRHAPKPPPPKPPPPSRPEPVGLVHIADLDRDHCRWMPGLPSTLMYCGKHRSPGSPYCASHTAQAYNR